MSFPEPAFADVANFRALAEAAHRASRGHRRAPEVDDFFLRLEPEVLRLERELLSGTYRPAPWRTFFIREPKPRTISAALFLDRVVHHAVCHVLEPGFEAMALPGSHGCRKGRGVFAAVRLARRMASRHPWVLKMDILHFFETVDHGVLKRMLARWIRDPDLQALVDRFIDAGAPGSPLGRGLPIGNLTSQHFANHYLGALDRLLVRGLGVPGHIRYMDDILVFGPDKEFLHRVHRTAAVFVRERLHLALKPEATRIQPVHTGVSFLGFVIFPGLVRFDPARVRRWRRKMDRIHRACENGMLEESEASARIASLIGWANHADSLAMRRAWLDRRMRRPGTLR